VRRSATAVAVAGLLALAACSSDGTSNGTSPSTNSGANTTAGAAPSTTQPGTTQPATTTASTVPLAAGAVAFTPVVSGLVTPVEVATRPDDPTLFVAQQDGRVIPVRDGKNAAPALDISALVSKGPEQGLLGLAFHPTLPLAYVDYTNAAGDTVVAEYAVAEDGTFDPQSARTVLGVDQPYQNHNGGEVRFGPDDMLYIGLGDGGAAGDPQRHGQDLGSLLGKILRIDPVAKDGKPYTVPADNPFVSTAGAKPEVWTYGLRNPWRFSFDSATGDLWIADVGQNKYEEVDLSLAADGAGKGANFGWSAFEATHPFNTDQKAANALAPIWEYEHGDNGCSVSGGTVYRGTDIPSLVGWYVVSDHCSSKVWAVEAKADGTLGRVIDLGVADGNASEVVSGPDGAVYVVAHKAGTLLKLTPA
jgi:glucose/arabinose dehydrogenase